MEYLILKALHVLGVVLFLGNIITGLFWHRRALISHEPKIIAQTMQTLIASDRWFTMPGVWIIIITGVANAVLAGYPLLRTPWIFWSLMLFSVSGIAFMFFIAPLQRKLYGIANADTFNEQAYRHTAQVWELWGALALITPLIAMILMVIKPDLPIPF